MKQCSNCGNSLPDDAGFCPQCGQPVDGDGAPALAADAVPTEAANYAAAADARSSAADAYASEADGFSDLKTRIGGGASRPASPPGGDLEPGSVFHDRYTIEAKLGEGAMGVVYKATDKVTDRKVALKLISSALIGNDQAVQRLIKEGLLARDIRHPNIIAMYDVGQSDEQTWLVMEYVEGESLRRWLQRVLKQGAESGVDIPYRIGWNLIKNILDGLQAAHAVGVIHRDLKPENIMLLGDPQAGDYRLKILDFGIAHATAGNAATNMTTTAATGTAYYMAPEQKTAADTVTATADLYAVTVMFYELLIGVPPEGRWQLPSKERDTLNDAVDGVIEKGLANRPRSRFGSAQDYLAALQTIPPLESVSATPDHSGSGPDIPLGGKTKPPAEAVRWWDRRSGNQKIAIIIGVLFVLLAAVLDEMGLLDDGINDGPPAPDWSQPAEPGKVGEYQYSPDSVPEPRPKPAPGLADFSGVWTDQLVGSDYARAVVDLQQFGNQLSGIIYLLPTEKEVGTLSGTVKGREMNYRYSAYDGGSGAGHGVMEADDRHVQIQVRADGGGMERHRLHLNHAPN